MIKNKRFVVFLALTVLMSLLSANFIVNAVQSYTPVVKYDEPVSVVVASAEIAPFTLIKPGQLKLKEMPASAVPDGALTDIKQAEGKAARTLLLKDDIIRAGHLTESGSTENEVVSGLSLLGDPNLRAVQVPLPKGFVLKKGDRIDIIYTERTRDSSDARIEFRNVLVLKAEEEHAFLALNCKDAERLAQMMSGGLITYAISPIGR